MAQGLFDSGRAPWLRVASTRPDRPSGGGRPRPRGRLPSGGMLAIGRTPTTSRSAAAGPCSPSSARGPGPRPSLGRARGAGRQGGGGAQERRDAPGGREASDRSRCTAFRDGYLPHAASEVKDTFEDLKARIAPDLVLTHTRDDLHQDHRLVCELTWNTFRDHMILEYEIPKWDGDIGRPNVYVPLEESVVQAEARSARRPLRHTARQGLVRRRGVPRLDENPWYGVPGRDRLCGSIRDTQARARPGKNGLDLVNVIVRQRLARNRRPRLSLSTPAGCRPGRGTPAVVRRASCLRLGGRDE